MTTSASSANATTLPVGPLASALAASAAALDAGPIETAYPDWLARHRSADEAKQVLFEIEQRYEEPERPRWHPALEEGGYITLVGDRPGLYRTCLDDSDKNVAWLRDRIARKPFNGWDSVTLEQSGTRAATTLAKILAWRAERDKRREAIGLPAVEAKAQELTAASAEAKRAILAITPSTYREAAFQAAVIHEQWDAGAAYQILDELLKLAGIPSDDGED